MNRAADIYGTVIAGGSVINLARLETAAGLRVSPGEIATASYTISSVDPCSRVGSSIAGHEERAIDPNAVLFDETQVGPAWQVDAVGYNFRHEIDVTEHPAFPSAGRDYFVRYRLVPVTGQPILFRFSIRAI